MLRSKGGEAHRFTCYKGAGAGNPYCLFRYTVRLGIIHIGTAGKAPGPINYHPHIKTAAGSAGDALYATVLYVDTLGGTLHDAHICIAGTKLLGNIQHLVR